MSPPLLNPLAVRVDLIVSKRGERRKERQREGGGS